MRIISKLLAGLVLVAMFVLGPPVGTLASFDAAYAKDVSGTWKGQSPRNKRWYQGGFTLKGTTASFNGRDSACRGARVPMKVTRNKAGVVQSFSGRGCGVTWNCRRSGSTFDCSRGNQYKTIITGVRDR